MPKRKTYHSRITREGHYRSRINLGRKDRAHVKLTYDTGMHIPLYYDQVPVTDATVCDVRQVPVLNPVQPLRYDVAGGTVSSFAGTGSIYYPYTALNVEGEMAYQYAQYYSEATITSAKLTLMLRSVPAINAIGTEPDTLSPGTVGTLDAYAAGPPNPQFFLFNTPPGVGITSLQGDLDRCRVQPGYKSVILPRSGEFTRSAVLSNFVVATTRGRPLEICGGAHSLSVSQTNGLLTPDVNWGTVSPLWYFGVAYQMSTYRAENPPAFWAVDCRVRLEYWVTYSRRRVYPDPGVPMMMGELSLEDLEKIPLAIRNDPRVDKKRYLIMHHMELNPENKEIKLEKKMGQLIIDDNGIALLLLPLLNV